MWQSTCILKVWTIVLNPLLSRWKSVKKEHKNTLFFLPKVTKKILFNKNIESQSTYSRLRAKLCKQGKIKSTVLSTSHSPCLVGRLAQGPFYALNKILSHRVSFEEWLQDTTDNNAYHVQAHGFQHRKRKSRPPRFEKSYLVETQHSFP